LTRSQQELESGDYDARDKARIAAALLYTTQSSATASSKSDIVDEMMGKRRQRCVWLTCLLGLPHCLVRSSRTLLSLFRQNKATMDAVSARRALRCVEATLNVCVDAA
jgi:hypothetical protein